jgi:hypothetical protein
MSEQLHQSYELYPKNDFTIKRKLENWTGNFNYWTGGVQSCKGRWGWCSEGGKFSALAANLSWAWDQPELQKANENCLHMRISANTSILLSDRECSNRFIYACQVFAAVLQKYLATTLILAARGL